MSSNSNAGATSLGSGQSNLDDLKDMPTFETVARRHLLNSTAVSRDEYKWNGDPGVVASRTARTLRIGARRTQLVALF